MTFLLMLIGAVLGAFICGAVFEADGWTGALFGLMSGLFLAQLRKLHGRLDAAERAISALHNAQPASMFEKAVDVPVPVSTTPIVTSTTASTRTEVAVSTSPQIPDKSGAVGLVPQITPPQPASAISVSTVAAKSHATDEWASKPREPGMKDKLWNLLKHWFTEGNVPVKVGMLVLFLGIGALLKYATDQGWLHVPIEFRLAGIAAAAFAALIFAWRKRESHRAFALSLQGGAIGVLILTIFAAFRLYAILPTSAAFGLLIVVVAATGMLAVLQDAMALAVLGIVGGFLAPILVSTDNGNHVALFSYYALLNAAIFAIAWIKPWRALNLLGFAFTFGIGTFWGALNYRPELFASTEPFLLLFFVFYLLLPLLYARKLADAQRDLIDGTLVFGTPLLAFPLQAVLLDGAQLPLAFSALGAAAIYTVLATLGLRRFGFKLLGQAHTLLALGFATLAVPLALSAHATACTWALEGTALVWLGLHQQRRLPRWIGYTLQAFAGGAFVFGNHGATDATPILNGDFFGALLIALAGFTSARLLSRARPNAPLAVLLFLWAWVWWTFAGGNEIGRFAPLTLRPDWWLALIAVTGLLGAELHKRLMWRESAWPAITLFAFALPLILLTSIDNHGPLEEWAAAAWGLWLVCALRTLYCLQAMQHRAIKLVHFVFLWTIALLLGVEFAYAADRHFALADIWVALAGLLPLAMLFWLALRRQSLVRWPLNAAVETLRTILLGTLAGTLALAWFAGLFDEGRPAPLAYVPILNPLELMQLGYLVLLFAWYRQAQCEGTMLINAELRARVLATAAFAVLTSITLRAVHFFSGVPWNEMLWNSPLAQASLSVSWSIAGIVAMLLGKQRGSRGVWIGGAVLMGVVIIKLGLVDRHYLHDLPAILGVLAVGLLLVGVGYFAPAPPRIIAAGDKK